MHHHTDQDDPPKQFINRNNEFALINGAFDALIEKKHLLGTPIIDFFGVDGIGKTSVLQRISVLCQDKNLPCIELDGKQDTARFSRAILQQTKKYRTKRPRSISTRKRNTHAEVIEALTTFLEQEPLVILLDSVDTTNNDLINWIEATLRALTDHDNLFVVLASKQKIVFENNWSMARKLTPFQLKPLNKDDSQSYLAAIDKSSSAEVREKIFAWTRGYPLAMDVMIRAIQDEHLEIENAEDQQKLIAIIMREVIDKKVLMQVEPTRLAWYKAYLSLLSFPRRFNLVIMRKLIEEYGAPPIKKTQSKLEYMGLPKQLNANTDVLHWDMQKAGFTIDESIRNIFFLYQRILYPTLFTEIHQFLAQQNKHLAHEVSSSDSVRYLREYLYHSVYSSNEQEITAILQSTLQQINALSDDAIVQFSEEFAQDHELQEILETHREYVFSFIKEHLAHEE